MAVGYKNVLKNTLNKQYSFSKSKAGSKSIESLNYLFRIASFLQPSTLLFEVNSYLTLSFSRKVKEMNSSAPYLTHTVTTKGNKMTFRQTQTRNKISIQ